MAKALGGVIGVVGGYSKFKEGQAMEQNGLNGIKNFKWKDLNNPFRTQQVSTLGSDLQTEQNQIADATVIDAARKSGTRGVIGATGSVVENSNDINRRIAAGLDEQQKAIDTNASQDDVRIRDMVENRQANELAGYGQMYNIGRQEKYGGINDAIAGVSSIGVTMGGLPISGAT